MFCWVLYHLKKVKRHVSKRGHEPKQQQEQESKEAGWQLTRKLGKARRPKTESETRESSNFQLSLRSHPTSVIAQQLSYWGGRETKQVTSLLVECPHWWCWEAPACGPRPCLCWTRLPAAALPTPASLLLLLLLLLLLATAGSLDTKYNSSALT